MSALLRVLITLFLITAAYASPRLSAFDDAQGIPDVRASFGEKDIDEVWLIVPTVRYHHYVHGQKFEPLGVRLRLSEGPYITLMLDEGFVFEDRTPRLADLDGDGKDEIILVLTSLSKGASLAAYSVVEGQLVLKAQTPFIGRPFRWLNPAGIADYNGDGQLDVALVQMPHLAKRLEIWTLENNELSREFIRITSVEDISNHHNGSTATGLSASADFNGDGVTDLAVVSGDYRTLKLFSFANGQIHLINSSPLPAPANGDFVLTPGEDGWHLRIPLQGNENFDLNISP